MTYDILIIGSGAAGLTAALNLAPHFKVAVLAKAGLSEGSTAWAQGGIAAVLEPGDSFASHIEDTMVAGAGLNNRAVVEQVVENAPRAIAHLRALGVPFSMEDDALHLTQEGGHSHRRIVHVDDATGWAVQAALVQAAANHPNIHLLEGRVAIDIITNKHAAEAVPDAPHCWGVYAYHTKHKRVEALTAKATILASGGAGRAYLFSTAPRGATGDGIAMAYRAGCSIANMEMMQFHPTCLYNLEVKNFLITEAVRGEGGRLLLPGTQTRFMPRFDPRAELAPRDIVARAIDHEIKRLGLDYVHLDISHKPEAFILHHFPNIHAKLLPLGIDMTKEPIPVVPAQHYTCGGVVVDARGRTDLAGLYGAGEVTHSGLHGANRLASNSLLECLVYGQAAARDILENAGALLPPPAIKPWDESRVSNSDEEVIVKHNWAEIRRFMWDYVGIVRTTKRLERAAHRVALLQQEVADYYGHFRVTPDLIELRNLITIAELIVRSALQRKESRGLHYILDYPELAEAVQDTILKLG